MGPKRGDCRFGRGGASGGTQSCVLGSPGYSSENAVLETFTARIHHITVNTQHAADIYRQE